MHQQNSDLSKIVTQTVFEQAYKSFIEQADINYKTKKANGDKKPYGFSEIPVIKGHRFKCEYGHGTASSAPHMNWYVVSIYYDPINGSIVIGIEEDRYKHLKEMTTKPLRYAQVGRKTVRVAVYYSTTKRLIDYLKLYDVFMNVCEEVIRLGLED